MLGAWVVALALAEGAPIANADFEAGRGQGWEEANSRGLALVRTGEGLPVAPYGGEWMGCLFAMEISESSRFGQMVKLPAEGAGRLTLRYQVRSEELCDVPYYDSLAISVGDTRVVDWTICRSQATDGWEPGHIDLSAFAGQTVALVFEAGAGSDGGSTIICVDDLALE